VLQGIRKEADNEWLIGKVMEGRRRIQFQNIPVESLGKT
jgi:hypothetical protein